MREPFVPPPYPYDRLDELKALAAARPGGLVDLSIGTPCDPPPAAVLEALAALRAPSAATRPRSARPTYREAAAGWMARRLGVTIDADHVAACVGTKELVAGIPQWLRLRRPDLDTVLYPAISYPTYAMGATLAGCRAVPYVDLDAIDPADAARALCLWVNVPGNPTGALGDLGAAAAWGRAHGVPVLSDECYVEFTWDGPPHTILEHGVDGVLAVHSLSKRSNLAGARAGFYAGDPALVRYLSEVRKHAGFMVPGPVQAAAVAAWADDEHVEQQRARYRSPAGADGGRLGLGRASTHRCPPVRSTCGRRRPTATPGASPVAWRPSGGALVSPGDFYGPEGAGHIRVAVVQPDDRLALVADRLREAMVDPAVG